LAFSSHFLLISTQTPTNPRWLEFSSGHQGATDQNCAKHKIVLSFSRSTTVLKLLTDRQAIAISGQVCLATGSPLFGFRIKIGTRFAFLRRSVKDEIAFMLSFVGMNI
jgi:hypothetical protein